MQRAPEFKDTKFFVNFEKPVFLKVLCPELVNLTRPEVVRGKGRCECESQSEKKRVRMLAFAHTLTLFYVGVRS